MNETGTKNNQTSSHLFHDDISGFANLMGVHWNWSEAALLEAALENGEGRLSAEGALVVETGLHTGRSAQDKFVVRTPDNEAKIWWDNNKALEQAHFDRLHADMMAHAEGKILFANDLVGGADPENNIRTRVYTEQAWHSLFIRNLLIRPTKEALASFVPQMTIVDLPSFKADPERHGCRTETLIACDLDRKLVLIAGTSYGGEMKKSVFTMLNYLLPEKGIMPMHCSANVDHNDSTTIFFGLSGTGKTTLSADPERTLIGDDEHGWSANGIFNFEGGCYAKTIKLSKHAEPEIYGAARRFGTVLENVVLDPITRVPDFDDGSLTENTRAAYPLRYIPNASATGRAGQPETIVMLTADAFGVLPPIARLTPSQAMYHFLSGYTAKVAGTEKGVTEPQATFSTCFGAPFMPRHPSEYGNLLRDLIAKHDVTCWLVNTGWTGGAYGVGRRMPLAATRELLDAAMTGKLAEGSFRKDPNFGFDVPIFEGTEYNQSAYAELLDPRATWSDQEAYDRQAKKLVGMFVANFETFEAHVDADVMDAGPRIQLAAE